MKKEILVMVPHRSSDGKRIKSLYALLQSWRDTTSGKSDFLVGADRDDLNSNAHIFPEDIVLDINEEKLNVIKKINRLSSMYGKNYKYIYFVGNDCIFRTKGWEDIFLKEAENKKHVVFYGNDMLQQERLATHAFMSMNIILDIGFMGPECLNHMFVDNFWMAVGRQLGCLKYFPNIILEHLHYSNGKTEKDNVYEKNDSYYHQDQVSFINYMNNQFLKDIKKVK